jgi:hypothetical protein
MEWIDKANAVIGLNSWHTLHMENSPEMRS